MQLAQTVYKDTNNYYRVVDHCSVQINGEWVDAYIYVEADKSHSVYAHKYVRPIVEFHQKFSPVLEEVELSSINDSESLLDKLRSGQLADIFGKYKLF